MPAYLMVYLSTLASTMLSVQRLPGKARPLNPNSCRRRPWILLLYHFSGQYGLTIDLMFNRSL